MNSRAVSLPDLVTEKRRNTTMSLSEGFPGFDRKPALAMTAMGFAAYTGGPSDSAAKSKLAKVLPLYYRTRQFVQSCEKSGHRVPHKLQSDLRTQEQAVGQCLRPLHPLLFQRFDELQLDRLLRAMPFLRLSQGRWIFGAEDVAAWEPSVGECVFLLLSGKVALYPELNGAGEKTEVREGCVFGQQKFKVGDETVRDVVAVSARAEEACIIGLMSAQVLETAFSDRAFGNKRISQMVRNVPSLARIVKPPEQDQSKRASVDERGNSKTSSPKAGSEADDKAPLESKSIIAGLQGFSKIASAVHVQSGHEVLSDEPLDENILIVTKGGLEVRGDVHLVERLDSIPPKKVRIRLFVERAEKLAGDSIWDKLDPYCIVKLGDFKRFQTPVLWNVGPNPKWEYPGVLKYDGTPDETHLEFTVMDHDQFSADDLCGNGSIPIDDLEDGMVTKVELTRPKRGIFKSEQTLEEPAGRVIIHVKWDYEKVTSLTVKPKERLFPDQVLFTLTEKDCWGHENLLLGSLFKRTLEQASSGLKYALHLGELRIVGASPKGVNETTTCLKVSRKRFEEFIKQCAREKQFMQACRVSSLEKQNKIRDILYRLIKRWETEEASKVLRGGVPDGPAIEEQMDPSRFRVAYRDVKCHIMVRNALNLTGGSWFDKLDPYAIVRFRGSKAQVRTSVLDDAGSDPFWNSEGSLIYAGETAMEISVWDYDKYSAHDLIATGVLQVEQFAGGFEGMVPLNLPDGKRRKAHMKQMMIIMGIQWDPPRDPNLGNTKTTTLRGAIANAAASG
mmetsp:Transcript_102261/g.186884  ORF Transcript_102261/g.186884 Transcript_102261/m.186884 type:complete len:787 (-) Transcript_102261:173-2533(-)